MGASILPIQSKNKAGQKTDRSVVAEPANQSGKWRCICFDNALAGHAFDLPPTYTLIYAPRDADDVASVMRILDAAIAYMTRDPALPRVA